MEKIELLAFNEFVEATGLEPKQVRNLMDRGALPVYVRMVSKRNKRYLAKVDVDYAKNYFRERA
jgi:hypothetical protein